MNETLPRPLRHLPADPATWPAKTSNKLGADFRNIYRAGRGQPPYRVEVRRGAARLSRYAHTLPEARAVAVKLRLELYPPQ